MSGRSGGSSATWSERGRAILPIGVKEEMRKGGAEKGTVYTTESTRGGCVYVIAIWTEKLDSVDARHIRTTTGYKSSRSAINTQAAAKYASFIFFRLSLRVKDGEIGSRC